MSKENIAKSAIGVTIVMIIGYLLSFGKEAVVAYYFGVSPEVDAYTIAIQVPVILFSFVAVAIQSVVVPLYSDLYYNQGRNKADLFASNLIVIVTLFVLLFFILGETFASGLIYLFAPGFNTEVHNLAVTLLRITLPTVFFSLIVKVYTAILNVNKKYVIPELSLLLLNIGLIVSIVLLHALYGIVAACIGQIVGTLLQFAFLGLLIRKYFAFSFYINPKDEKIKQALKMSLPVFWSISVAELNAMINRMVASFLFVGSIAALSYSQKLNTIFISFFTSAIATIVYPLYAESAAKGDTQQLNSRINLTLSAYAFFLLPVMAFLLCFKREVVTLAFARGAFDSSAIDLTQELLGFYVFGLLFLALRGTVTNVFYSLKDSATPAKNATIGVLINLVLNLSLPFVMGINGLALATALSAIYITGMLIFLLLKKYKEFELVSFFRNLKGIVIAAVVTSLVLIGCRYFLSDVSDIIRFSLGVLCCAICYLISVFILRIPIFVILFDMIKKKVLRDLV